MLLDTSGLLCCFDAADVRLGEAVQRYEAATRRLTHNFVLAEFVALTQARGLPREASLAFAADVAADADIDVAWVTPGLHEAAMALLRSQTDKATGDSYFTRKCRRQAISV